MILAYRYCSPNLYAISWLVWANIDMHFVIYKWIQCRFLLLKVEHIRSIPYDPGIWLYMTYLVISQEQLSLDSGRACMGHLIAPGWQIVAFQYSCPHDYLPSITNYKKGKYANSHSIFPQSRIKTMVVLMLRAVDTNVCLVINGRSIFHSTDMQLFVLLIIANWLSDI